MFKSDLVCLDGVPGVMKAYLEGRAGMEGGRRHDVPASISAGRRSEIQTS